MKIERLVLKNFRGIREMDLEFNERLTVLIGENGAGKSSILHALALPLSDVFRQRPLWEGGSPSGAKNSDVLNGESAAKVRVFLKSDRPDFDLAISCDASHGVDEAATFDLKKSESVKRMEESLRRDRKSSGSLLAIRYLPERRIGRKHATPSRRDILAPAAAYGSALECGRGHRQFFTWFRKRQNEDLLSLQVPWSEALQSLKRGDRPPGTDSFLFAARSTIADFMGARALYFQDGMFYVYKGGQEFSVNQLSDGEKGLLGLVGDLTYRLAVTHPHLTAGDQLLQKAEAVVMIDEMEQHLHPAWQRMVVPQLLETFPNVQFIITTHSPQVLSHVEDKSVFLLRQTDEGIVHAPLSEVYGQSYERLLEDVFGVGARPDEVQKELDELFDLIQRNHVPEARRKFDELRRRIGTDPDMTLAGFRLHRKDEMTQ